MRHGFPRQRHTWNHISDQKLFDAVQLYGTDNWSIGGYLIYIREFVSQLLQSQESFRKTRPLPNVKDDTSEH